MNGSIFFFSYNSTTIQLPISYGKFLLFLPVIYITTGQINKNRQNFWRESATNLPAYLRIGYKSPCLFANDLQISLPICKSVQISLPICKSSTNLPAYLRQKFCLFLLIRPVIRNLRKVKIEISKAVQIKKH